ncbi:MAG: ATPase [Ruminococcaceae bacterium]|nr:ATPase [Oscillospiraceae bacterium]
MKRVEELINELQGIMEEAKAVPLTGGKALIDTETVMDILDEIRDSLPSEVRQAKNIVADRGQIIAEAKKEAEAIVREAEQRREKLIEKESVVIDAKNRATEIENATKAKLFEMKKAATDFVEDIMKKADEALAEQLTELRKTRQNIKMANKVGNNND